MLSSTKKIKYIGAMGLALMFTACVPALVQKTENKSVPTSFGQSSDSTNTAKLTWKVFFKDPNLTALIDTALQNNQELNIMLQEITIAQNEARARKGAYLPFLNLQAGAGVEKSSRYTRMGALEANENNQVAPGKEFPDPLPNYLLAANVTWEVDIWKKLRNARKSAILRYLATTEGRNFMVTNLIAEIANSYFELMALDNQLAILRRNIEIQQNALGIVRMEKQAARVNELAVRRFEAEVLKNQSRQYDINQQIIQIENRINFLVGRFPKPVERAQNFMDVATDTVMAGIPAQLLQNRPDIRRAEQELAAAKLDVKAARANFYPSLVISSGVGFQAFSTDYFIKKPESLLFLLAGDLVAPLVNRNGIKAEYYAANARQVQTVYNYQRAILNAYLEVANQLSNINNLKNSYNLRAKQVDALNESINISTSLFKSARADYMEVLLTQRDALESRFELVETKRQQFNAMVNVYQALGGGWR